MIKTLSEKDIGKSVTYDNKQGIIKRIDNVLDVAWIARGDKREAVKYEDLSFL